MKNNNFIHLQINKAIVGSFNTSEEVSAIGHKREVTDDALGPNNNVDELVEEPRWASLHNVVAARKGEDTWDVFCMKDISSLSILLGVQYLNGRVISVELAKPTMKDFGRYPKTCGPPVERLPSENDVPDLKENC
ncbi:hypothetical protein T459_04892 [Capsicum annuum]|uniref:Uncharacterized protein n=1 Tax=Capsicum annuum TaxID=4072 RepID=A0A2G3A6A0_CAPAN|nr:hypothetical protein T459_04892 [Capsicum annuum]